MKRERRNLNWLPIVLVLGCLAAVALLRLAEAQVKQQPRQTLAPAGRQQRAELLAKVQRLKPNDLDQATKANLVHQWITKTGHKWIPTPAFISPINITPQLPRENYFPARADLFFRSADWVSFSRDMASMNKGGSVYVDFVPLVPGAYLVDFAAKSWSGDEAPTYILDTGHDLLTLSVPDSVGHVAAVVAVGDTSRQTFILLADRGFNFWSCEISLIK